MLEFNMNMEQLIYKDSNYKSKISDSDLKKIKDQCRKQEKIAIYIHIVFIISIVLAILIFIDSYSTYLFK